jgi:hypothetical protein
MQERLLVYQRAGEPCPRCSRPIRRIVVGGRSTHFCSWCQRLPPADRAGAAAILRGMEPRIGRAGPAAGAPRTGPRWIDLGSPDGALGTATGSTKRAAGRRRNAEATRKAAATRRALARASQTGPVSGERGPTSTERGRMSTEAG